MILKEMSNSVSMLVSTLSPVNNLGFSQKIKFAFKPTLLMIGLFHAFTAHSDDSPSHQACLPELIAPSQEIPAPQKQPDLAKKTLEADKLEQLNDYSFRLEGKAVLKQPGTVLLSDEIRFDQKKEQAVFNNNISLHQSNITILAEKAQVDTKKQQATLEQTQFQILPSRAHGHSEEIQLDGQKDRVKLKQADLTTCVSNPDRSVDWKLKFDQIEVNQQTRRVIGKNTALYVKGVPVFYTPYFDYPLDDRASGLLFPEIGSYKSITSDDKNQYIKLPYYFNIAENMDNTLSVIPVSRRGLVIDNEFRYIEKTADVLHSAELTLTALNDDQVADKGLTTVDEDGNVEYGDKDANRWRAKIKANQYWGDGLSSAIQWQEVSDESFFREVPVERQLKNASLQSRYIRMDYQRDNLHLFGQLQSYMQLLNADDNYEKRPELGLTYSSYHQNFDFDLSANVTDFYVPSSNHQKAEGIRLHLTPQVSHRIQNNYAYLNTTARANFTQYQMEDNGFNPSTKSNLSRTVPQIAVRSGLIFEREVSLDKQSFTQTLEPEVQYLYTPYVNQSDFALFDTAERSLDFSNLFSMNRFTGSDRIGDTSQVSMALTSRLLNQNGSSVAEAGIGQIAYLKDRKVDINNQTQTEDWSDWFVKMSLTSGAWQLSSNTQYDRDNLALTNANTRLKWQSTRHQLFINHTLYEQNSADKVDMLSAGLYSKISSNWELGLYNSYNLDTRKPFETEIGLRYDSCCWSAEIVAERTQLENGLYNDGIGIQFELKGLSTSSSQFKKSLTNKLDF